jgi:hypothetical protein
VLATLGALRGPRSKPAASALAELLGRRRGLERPGSSRRLGPRYLRLHSPVSGAKPLSVPNWNVRSFAFFGTS